MAVMHERTTKKGHGSHEDYHTSMNAQAVLHASILVSNTKGFVVADDEASLTRRGSSPPYEIRNDLLLAAAAK